MTPKEIKQQFIESLRENNGLINPEMLVRASKPKNAPTHDDFEWDDSVAGHEFRIWQARKLIAVYVTIIDNGKAGISTRAYVSLSNERGSGGGYRAIIEVLNNSQFRERMFEDALAELQAFRRKYGALKELYEIFEATDNLKRRRQKVAA